jgi:predicted secreted Zn-dependent protease
MLHPGCAAVLAISAALCLAGPADASVKVKARTTSYNISGKNGEALLDAMDRRGPKHGFLARAIAQTSYTISWDIDWREKGDSCRIADAAATLSVTYNYPTVSNALSGDMKRRWQRFMSGVRKHEQMHGRIAREMVNAAERRLTGLSSSNDPGCRKTQAEVKRRIAAIYAKYEARQARFDDVEHAGGGNVEGLVKLLSRGK